jgi:hypothetical protein
MTSERNKGAVEALKQLEANHVKEFEEHEAERINALKEKLEKRYKRGIREKLPPKISPIRKVI